MEVLHFQKMTTEMVEQPTQAKNSDGAKGDLHENKLPAEAVAAAHGDSATDSDGETSAPELEDADPSVQQAQRQVTLTVTL